jgi:hypothetical protein
LAPSDEREVRLDAPAIEEAAGTEDLRDRRDRGSEDRSRSSLELAVPLSEPLLEEPPRNIVSALALTQSNFTLMRTSRFADSAIVRIAPCFLRIFSVRALQLYCGSGGSLFLDSLIPEGTYVS